MTVANPFDLISDLFKEARGFRPSGDWMRHFNSLPYAEQEQIWDGLIVEADESQDEEAQREAAAVVAFRALIEATISAGAADASTALRWLRDADEKYGWHDLGYFLWSHGIYSSAALAELGKDLGFGWVHGHLKVIG